MPSLSTTSTRTGLAPLTSAPGLGLPLLPICTRNGLALLTSAPGLGSPLPHLPWDCTSQGRNQRCRLGPGADVASVLGSLPQIRRRRRTCRLGTRGRVTRVGAAERLHSDSASSDHGLGRPCTTGGVGSTVDVCNGQGGCAICSYFARTKGSKLGVCCVALLPTA